MKDSVKDYQGWASSPEDQEMRKCFCIGPQGGAPFCPCMMRDREAEKNALWLEGFKAGQKAKKAAS